MRDMTLRRPLCAAALGALAALLGCSTPRSNPAPTAPPSGANPSGPFATPAQTPTKLNLVLKHYRSGGEANLGALAGKVVLVDFWATWCGPCHAAAQAYQRLYKEYGPQGLEVYGVSVDDEGAPIDDFINVQGITYPILLDPAAQISAPRFDIDSIPVTLIADRQGMIRFTHRGFEGDSEDEVKREIEQLLAEK